MGEGGGVQGLPGGLQMSLVVKGDSQEVVGPSK